jgi:hypothetical protein
MLSGSTLDLDKLFELATPYLEKNDFGVGHTQRVYDIAKSNFEVNPILEELTFASIILHDVGGSTVKEQYEKGPEIAKLLLQKLNCSASFSRQVCKIISTHHEHPDNPSDSFQVLYDSDKIVMFSKEEYPHYNAQKGFDWNKIIHLIYSDQGKELAKKWWIQRKKESNR